MDLGIGEATAALIETGRMLALQVLTGSSQS
jgi:hypothetical protein